MYGEGKEQRKKWSEGKARKYYFELLEMGQQIIQYHKLNQWMYLITQASFSLKM